MPSGVVRFEHDRASLVDEVLGDSASRHLVFLHGWGGSRESLRGVAALFAHTHSVHLIDLPGFGEAPAPPTDWGTARYADLVQRYLQDRVQGPIVLIGHSFGGKISVALASRQMEQVRGVVLIGVPGLPQPAFSRVRLRRTGIRLLRRALQVVRPLLDAVAPRARLGSRAVDWHTKRFGSRDYLAAGALRSILVRIVNEDLTATASTIACPVLLLWGTDDTETPPWLAHRYQALIGRRSTLALLPHKDHFPFSGTGAHLCGYRVREWLRAEVHV